MKKEAFILDPCSGGKMFYYDKNSPLVDYLDIRNETVKFSKDRILEVHPDKIQDFRHLPIENETYSLIIFDPPHIYHGGKESFMIKKYGKLPEKEYLQYLKEGFKEVFRVLKENGTLIFKWSQYQIPIKKVFPIIPYKPLLGDKSGNKRWTIFIKNSYYLNN